MHLFVWPKVQIPLSLFGLNSFYLGLGLWTGTLDPGLSISFSLATGNWPNDISSHSHNRDVRSRYLVICYFRNLPQLWDPWVFKHRKTISRKWWQKRMKTDPVSSLEILVRSFKMLTNLGCIEFEEFLNMMRRKMKENENSMDDVKAAFKVFDQNGDG